MRVIQSSRLYDLIAAALNQAAFDQPSGRLNGEIERRSWSGIVPNEDAMIRLIGAFLFEQKMNGPYGAPVTSHWKSLPRRYRLRR